MLNSLTLCVELTSNELAEVNLASEVYLAGLQSPLTLLAVKLAIHERTNSDQATKLAVNPARLKEKSGENKE